MKYCNYALLRIAIVCWFQRGGEKPQLKYAYTEPSLILDIQVGPFHKRNIMRWENPAEIFIHPIPFVLTLGMGGLFYRRNIIRGENPIEIYTQVQFPWL